MSIKIICPCLCCKSPVFTKLEVKQEMGGEKNKAATCQTYRNNNV